MKKFVNHVDHVTYLSRLETLHANIAELETIFDAKMERCETPAVGAIVCVDWSTGIEVVAPLPGETEENAALRDRLASHGEGIVAVVYAVENLELHVAKMEAKGFTLGPLMLGQPNEPWFNRIVLRERFGPSVMGTWTVFSQIDYGNDLIRFAEVRDAATVD